MNEEKIIIKDKIKTYIYNSLLTFGIVFGFSGMIFTLELENNFTYACTFLFLASIPLMFPLGIRYEKRFDGKRLGCNVYSFKHLSYEDLLQNVHDYAMKNGYTNKDELITCREEEFTVYFKDKPYYLEYPKEKICVYYDSTYKAEVWKQIKTAKYQYKESRTNYTFGKAEQIKFQKMVCGNWGRHYTYPRDWVDVETILIIMVEEWNETLNWVMNQSGNLPFVLVSLMVKSDPDVIYVTKDIHKNKRDDYQRKINELFDLLDVKNRFIIRNLKYTEVKNRIKPQDEDRIKYL